MTWWHSVGLVATALVIGAADTEAQWIGLERVRGQLGAKFQQNSFSGDRFGTWGRFHEWAQVGLSGHVYHPNLLSFGVGLRPMWLQGYSRGIPEPGNDATGQLGYNARVRIFRNKPVHLSALANRVTGTRSEILADGREFDRSRMEAELRFRNQPLPVTLRFRDESTFEMLPEDGGLRTVRDDRISSAWLRAQNSKLNASLSWVHRDMHVLSRSQTAYTGDLDHRFGWGKGSLLTSRLGFTSRSGVVGSSRRYWSEQVRLQHTRDFSSSLRYLQSNTASGPSETGSRVAAASFLYVPSPSIRTSVSGSGYWSNGTTATRSTYRVGPRIGFQAGLPLKARLSTSGSLVYERVHQESVNGLMPVVGERHVVESSAQFTLEQRLADPASVVITDASQAMLYEEDLDFRLFESSGGFVEVFVLPGGRIALGDTLLVDYRYQVTETGGYRGIHASYAATVHQGRLEFFVRHNVRQPTDEASIAVFLETNEFIAGAAYSMGAGRWSTNLRAQYRRIVYNGVRGSQYSVHGALSTQIVRSLRSSVSTSLRRERGTGQPLNLVNGRFRLTWVPTGDLRIGVQAGVWWWRRGEGEPDLRSGVAMDLRYRLGLTELTAQFIQNERRNGREWTDQRLLVGLTRGF